MIGRLVAFALHQRFITLALALLLTVGGIASYNRLPSVPQEHAYACQQCMRMIRSPPGCCLNRQKKLTRRQSQFLYSL